MRLLFVMLLTAMHAVGAGAAEVDPVRCLAAGSSPITVEWGGRTFRLASEACRELFNSDPERYGQLFEALSEAPPQEPRAESLVPS